MGLQRQAMSGEYDNFKFDVPGRRQNMQESICSSCSKRTERADGKEGTPDKETLRIDSGSAYRKSGHCG